MAQIIKLKRGTTTPTTSDLANGEVAVDTSAQKFYINDSGTVKEIGGGGGSGTVYQYADAGMVEYEFTATANQTTFSGTDDNSATLSYTAESILVFLNGVLQDDGVDYTATNGTSVVFSNSLALDDEVKIIAISSTASLHSPTKLDTITTVNGQAAYSMTVNSTAYEPSHVNALIVSVNGITQEPGDSYTISGSTITFDPALSTGDVVDYIVDMGRKMFIPSWEGDLEVTNGDIIGDFRGPLIFSAKAAEALTKGDVVYIAGVSGQTPTVGKADADDSSKMPAFGLVQADTSLNNACTIVTFGSFKEYDTSTPGWSLGDTLYVSTTAGSLTNTPPAGESSLIQNIGKVQRVDSTDGRIKVGGAGRTNATPNLNDGNIFIGNSSNQVTTSSFNTLSDARISAASIGDLTDVDITTAAPTNLQVLKWDNANSKFIPGDAASSVANLTDVDLTGLANNSVLKYDSTASEWIVGTNSTAQATANVIIPFAFASVATTSNGSGTNISWSNWNSLNSTLDFTFGTAQANTNYAIITDSETFDDYFVGISNKTTTGFRAEFYDNSGSRTPSSFSPFSFVVYAETPTETIYADSYSSVGDLPDVTITSPSSGQVLKYNGTAWVNSSDSVGATVDDATALAIALG